MSNNYGDIGSVIGFVFLGLFSLAVLVFYIICMWKIFVKAGKPGWAILVPFYNTLVELEILGRPWWFLLLIIFIPIADFVIGIIMIFDMARVFGKSTGFGFGLLFLSFIFIPIIAFSDAKYIGPIAGQ